MYYKEYGIVRRCTLYSRGCCFSKDIIQDILWRTTNIMGGSQQNKTKIEEKIIIEIPPQYGIRLFVVF